MHRFIKRDFNIRTSKLPFLSDNLFDYLSCSETADNISSRASSQINGLLLKTSCYNSKFKIFIGQKNLCQRIINKIRGNYSEFFSIKSEQRPFGVLQSGLDKASRRKLEKSVWPAMYLHVKYFYDLLAVVCCYV